MESIGDALQKANLSQYITPLLDIGADDTEQLASLPESDFQSLLDMTGMSKKPFHVLRFKKAINRSAACPPVGGGPGGGLMGGETVGESSTHTVTVYATQIDDPATIDDTLQSLQRPSTAAAAAAPMQASSTPAQAYSLTASFLELPPTPAPRLTPLTKQQLEALVDDTIPVQQELGPSPISPEIWDKERREIFRKASVIFSNSISPLTDQEQVLNEAAFQLCLWDPTLLVRQKDLFLLAKKLIKHYLPFPSEIDHPMLETKGDPSWPSSSSSSSNQASYGVSRGPDGKFRTCFEENYERRELQIQQIELLIAENASKEKMKQALLLQAKEKMDYSLALKIQEELSVLGKTQREYKTEMSRLRKVQRRSIRHQEMKKMKKTNKTPENPSTTTSGMQPPPYSLPSTQPANDVLVTMPKKEQGEGKPLQLHMYTVPTDVATAAAATTVHSYTTGLNPVLSSASSSHK